MQPQKFYVFESVQMVGNIQPVNISAFIVLLIPGVERVPFKSFVQFTDVEFIELMDYLHAVISIFWIVKLKSILNL